MPNHPLLGLLSRLSSSVTSFAAPDHLHVQAFQQAAAHALVDLQDPETILDAFSFEQVHPTTADASEAHLNQLLEQATIATGTRPHQIRIFRRETSFRTSQLRGSVPEWARGAEVLQTLGPFAGANGRNFWVDIFQVVPGVQVTVQGSALPAVILSIVSRQRLPVLRLNVFAIPECTVWVNARLLAAEAPEGEYVGLAVTGGQIAFSANSFSFQNNRISVPPNVRVTLKLTPKAGSAPPPNESGFGKDAAAAQVATPDTWSFSFDQTGLALLAAAPGSWTVFGSAMDFQFLEGSKAVYLKLLNRVGIPFQPAQPDFGVQEMQSPLCTLQGNAPVIGSWWGLNCARIDINATPVLAGSGGMVIKTSSGLTASWLGLKDITLEQQEWVGLQEPFVLAETGRISVTDLIATGHGARQEFVLWPSAAGKPNRVHLKLERSFLFMFNSSLPGTDAVLAQGNCTGHIDRPVGVNGKPLSLYSLQTALLLMFHEAGRNLVLYDDNILTDNFKKEQNPAGSDVTVSFRPQGLALNNALFTVSPVNGFMLRGTLSPDSEGTIESASLIYTFGLLHYLPALPDPYAADVSLYQPRPGRMEGREENRVLLTQIRHLLVATITWKREEKPITAFTLGDVSGTSPGNNQQISMNLLANQGLAAQYEHAVAQQRTEEMEARYEAAGNNSGTTKEEVRRRSPGLFFDRRLAASSSFRLLDVSTAADLMGISVGFINERYFFGENFQIEPIDDSQNPVQIEAMDVMATSRFVRVFALPQVSWEPVINLTKPFNVTNDPPEGFLRFDNDGLPALIGNTGNTPVALAPLPLTRQLVQQYKENDGFKVWSIFTLPNGLLAKARYNQKSGFDPAAPGARLELVEQRFGEKIETGLQLSTYAVAHNTFGFPVFEGNTEQWFNVTNLTGSTSHSILGSSVTKIFHEFFNKQPMQLVGVPLERFDFTGYGAQVFSTWLYAKAGIAEVSQAIFDIWRGRTSREIIQVRSLLYPWAVRVVRTITMYRGNEGFEFRTDSGWKADSDGVYDFAIPYQIKQGETILETGVESPYVFHPGLVKGVFQVRNIIETDAVPFEKKWAKNFGIYINPDDAMPYRVAGPPKPLTDPLDVELIPVTFDADVRIDDVEIGGKGNLVPAKGMMGYLQLAPRGVPIAAADFEALLLLQKGLGGPVDCTVNINQSGQRMRLSRVEVQPSRDEGNNLVFVVAAKGMPVLPKDGSWSMVLHNKTSKEVVPVSESPVALVRAGMLNLDPELQELVPKEIAVPSELFKNRENRLFQYGLLQNTDTQKVLFRNPFFESKKPLLFSSTPDLADAYRLLNSNGIFPRLEDLQKVELDAHGIGVRILEEGYKLVDKAALDLEKTLEQKLLNKTHYFIDSKNVKVYLEYATTEKDGTVKEEGSFQYDLNSTANRWLSKMNNITIVVDLLEVKRLFLIRGKMDTAKNKAPAFINAELVPGEKLQPIVDILQILAQLAIEPDYKELVKKGLKVAMSNSPNNWVYKFKADKEIPVLRFPPKYLDGPTTPLRLEANMKLGVYFNLPIPLPLQGGVPAPSAGAFIEFGGKLSVMCVSLAAATVYAVGTVVLRIGADNTLTPAFYLKAAFGVELMVGLPVVGNVSVTYAVGIEASIDSTGTVVGGFLMFRGRAELIGGLVTVTIQIEAAGKVRAIGNRTDCIAQVTFSIDISICFVIDIDFTESWEESRQIA